MRALKAFKKYIFGYPNERLRIMSREEELVLSERKFGKVFAL